MAKILNTTYHDTVEKVTGFYENLVNNPFYTLNDKKPVICTYYNINKDFSSLDPGSKLHMANIGSESPIRYNRIYDFILYGFQRIELNTDNGEFGLEADKIEGECYILPNTIIPTEGDYFEVDHITDSTWLFIVKDVQKDTLDNGSNAYKINYKLEYIDHNEILSKIVHNFRHIETREGTNIDKIVRCEDYDIAKIMDEKAVMLKEYFCNLFYNDKVQTFIYCPLTEFRVYDQYMIEFLIRNSILDNGEDSKYIDVSHQIPVPNTFSIDYDKTIFRYVEKRDKENILSSYRGMETVEIKSYGTLFGARYENYYKAIYNNDFDNYVNSIDDKLIYDIFEGNIVEDHPENSNILWKNIIIKHFLKQNITVEELNSIDNITFEMTTEAFYNIPILIYCLEKAIENVLKST